ncbi:P-loop containing nucleoside triphosphate hydrolase protein [Patellaria atrata CBS 101060]|uniref:P-loop containing nucleoside triphosphate hydrolase protein n=1 Tax=Patellaria atrata CBS 101060 TaxID=1346257 RepID=A0A9P4VT32_9PEZI|nr:P-loop containing nucleoside triphosphate hydrolase protein [Patellaria atrata CBS 101060]
MKESLDLALRPSWDETGREWFNHSSAPRIFTDAVVIESLRKQYPELKLVVAPQGVLNLLAYAAAGHATATSIGEENDPVYSSLRWRQYIPPARRIDGAKGTLANVVLFGKYIYKWKNPARDEPQEFLVYIINGRDGSNSYPAPTNHYILCREERDADDLILTASQWGTELHNEVWVFDGGYFQKSYELWESVQHAEWENVILDADIKKAIIKDVTNFFDSRETYEKLKVPWKRGVIYYGPPGNGKTISIKAMMHTLYERKDPIPTVYVRTLTSFAGPEWSLSQIFGKARQVAPCYLVFEDLDSIVSDAVRSYFLNEVDGLRSNDGILMIGSTNHLDRLDPGISKRPSRFDRKYFFPNPDFAQRAAYAAFWQRKLADNPDIEFPDKLCKAIASITDGFSFAYMQEAFVATLLTIAAYDDTPDQECWNKQRNHLIWQSVAQKPVRVREDGDGELEKLLLWREIKKQVRILREEMGGKGSGFGKKEL